MDQTSKVDLDAQLDRNLGSAEIELQDDLEGDTLREECGVFGIFGHPSAAAITALGLHALQHRGQEAAGVVTYDQGQFIAERHPGLVGDINVIDADRIGLFRPELVRDLPADAPRLVQRAKGYQYTVKAGEVTFDHGESTGARPGILLRGSR